MENLTSSTSNVNPLNFEIGFRYLINETAWEVSHLNKEIDVIRLREVNGTRKFTDTILGFKKRIRCGSAKLQRGISKLTLASLTESTLTDNERRKYDMRKAYVTMLDTLPSGSSKKKRRHAINKLHSERASQLIAGGTPAERRPGLSTVYEWKRKANQANGLLITLAIKDHRTSKRSHRLDTEIFAMLRESFEQIYKSEQRFTISDIHSVITARVRLENEDRDPTLPPLKIPCRQTINQNLGTFDPLGAYEARFGKHKSRMNFNYGGKISVPDYVCGLVYADCHLIDVLVRDERLGIPYRPWLLAFMCGKTRCVTGWEISALPPSAEKLTRALRMALTESTESEFRGAPAILLVDNGKEFRNGTHKTIASILNFEIEFPPPETPNAKAPMERFFRTLNYFIHRLAGSVGSNPFDKGDYDAEGNAVYTLAQVQEIFQDFLNIYHHRSMSSLGQAPKTLWELNVQKLPPRVFDAEFIRTLGSKTFNRDIHKGRVQVNGLFWHSPSLPELEMRLNKDGKKAIVHIDQNDLTDAWVRHPDEPGTAIRCDPCDEYQKGLTMKLHEEIMDEKIRIEKETGNEQRMQILKARFILKSLKNSIEKKKNLRKTNRSRVEWHDQLIRVADTMNSVDLITAPFASISVDADNSNSRQETQNQIDLGWDAVPNSIESHVIAQQIQPSSSGWDDVPVSY
jgi:putative transposase